MTPAAKLRQRAEYAESVAIGMGLLLLKLNKSYGHDFGIGMNEQIDQALADYRLLCKQAQQRDKSKAGETK